MGAQDILLRGLNHKPSGMQDVLAVRVKTTHNALDLVAPQCNQ